MQWFDLLSYFFGGAFLANAVPHFVAGVMGEPFQTPFAMPPGQGLSSSTVNVLWGFFNLVLSYLLVVRIVALISGLPPMPRRSGSACSQSACSARACSAVSTAGPRRSVHEHTGNRRLPVVTQS